MDMKDFISRAADNVNPLCNVTSVKSRDNHLYLVYELGSDSYKLNSTYRPVDEAVKWASQFNVIKKRSVVYMFGLGNGYFARELIKKLPEDGGMIIIEPSYDIFNHVSGSYDLMDILKDSRVHLFLGREDERRLFASIEAFVHWTNLSSQMICTHPGYEKIFYEDIIRYEAVIQQNSEKEVRNRNTEAHFGKRRVENTIKNLRLIKNSNVLSDISRIFPRDIPAIIVAAGPSLDKNIHHLKQAEGRAFIVGCDTALRHMYRHQVTPDITVTVDADKPDWYFDNAGFEKLTVFTTASANYKALLKGNGRKIWFSGHAYQIELYKRLGKNLSYRTGGGSVATAAFAICASLGFKTIILIGQDLAYNGEATHAGGEKSWIRNEKAGITYVEGIDGSMVKTRSDWVSFLKWYKNAISNLDKGTDVIDATEGGALIEGTRVMSLQDVVDKYCVQEFSFLDKLDKIKPFDKNIMNQINRCLDKSLEDASRMEELLIRSVMLAEECLDEFERVKELNAKINENNKELSLINQNIEQMPVYCLVDEYARKETMGFVQELVNTSEDEEDNIRNYYINTINIHKELAGAAGQVKQFLKSEDGSV